MLCLTFAWALSDESICFRQIDAARNFPNIATQFRAAILRSDAIGVNSHVAIDLGATVRWVSLSVIVGQETIQTAAGLLRRHVSTMAHGPALAGLDQASFRNLFGRTFVRVVVQELGIVGVLAHRSFNGILVRRRIVNFRPIGAIGTASSGSVCTRIANALSRRSIELGAGDSLGLSAAFALILGTAVVAALSMSRRAVAVASTTATLSGRMIRHGLNWLDR